MIPFLALLYRSRRPLVNFALIAINLLVFLYELALNDFETFQFTYRFGLIPAALTSGATADIIPVSTNVGIVAVNVASPISPWGTVFTSMFLHGSVVHIMANMLFLWGFGDKVEARLGHIKYLLFYLGAGIAAAWTQVSIDLDSTVPIIGASGAIFGVLGAYLLAFPYRNTLALLLMFFILPLFFSIGSFSPGSPGSGIAYMAHVGGFVSGVLFMAAYKYLLREPILPQRPWRSWRYRR